VVKPLTAGFASSTLRPVRRSSRFATIEGQAHESDEAPVPIV
jgi:hypothetical protein